MNKSKIKKIIYIVLIASWMGVIFALSNMGGNESDGQSKGVSQLIVDGGADILHKIGILREMPTREELDAIIDLINPPVRKCAHASEFFVLTFLCMLAVRDKDTWNYEIKKSCLIALSICILYCLTDEFHQLFISGRSGEIMDCVNDTLGGCIAILVYYIGYRIRKINGKIFKKHGGLYE